MFRFLIALLLSIPAHATLYDSDKQAIFAKNIMDNGGFENGKAGWTASGGTFTTVTSGTNLLTGLVSATWDSGSAAQTLSFKSVTIPKGLYGKNGVGVCKIQVPSGTATHTLQVTDGSNTLVSSTITSSTLPTYNFANFVVPSSGSLVIRIVSVASDEPLIAIDDCWLVDASEINLTNISQAQFVASGYFATTASCAWSRSNTAIGAFGTDTDCPGPTVILQGTSDCVLQTTDANLPQITLTNCAPGIYVVEGGGYVQDSNTGSVTCLAVTDGTTTGPNSCAFTSNGNEQDFTIAKQVFSYTSASDRTFQIHGSASANSILLEADANNKNLWFTVKRYPLSSQQALKPDQSASSWSGRHDSDCSWSRTNTAYGDPTADASCTFTESRNTNFGTVTSALSAGNKLPGIVFTPNKIGTYFMCATVSAFESDTAGAIGAMQMLDSANEVIAQISTRTDGTYIPGPLCGLYRPASLASETIKIQSRCSADACIMNSAATTAYAITWTIFAIDQSLPAPLLVNSVTNSSSGVTRTEVAKLNCDAGSAITSQHGSWVTSIGNISAGACAVTLTSGVFSATPYCNVSMDYGPIGETSPLIVGVNAISSTSVAVDCINDGGAACTAYNVFLQCVGAH